MPPKRQSPPAKPAPPAGWHLKCDRCGTLCFVPEEEWWVDCTSDRCTYFVVAPIAPSYMYVRIDCEETTYERVKTSESDVHCECCDESQRFIIDDMVVAERMNGQPIYATIGFEEAYDSVRDLRVTVNQLRVEKQELLRQMEQCKTTEARTALALKKKSVANEGMRKQLLKERERHAKAMTDKTLKNFDIKEFKESDERLAGYLKTSENLVKSTWEHMALHDHLNKYKKRCKELETQLAAAKKLPSLGPDCWCWKILGGHIPMAPCGHEEAQPGTAADPHMVVKHTTMVGATFSGSSSGPNFFQKFVTELEKTIIPKIRSAASLDALIGTAPESLPTFEQIVERFPAVKEKWQRIRMIYWQWLKNQEWERLSTLPGTAADSSDIQGDIDERKSEDVVFKKPGPPPIRTKQYARRGNRH